MSDYTNNRFSKRPFNKGGFRGKGAPSHSSSKNSGQRYRANCSMCGKAFELPFKPNGMKPVYCEDCFVKEDHDAPRGRREFTSRGDFASRRDFAPRNNFAPRPSEARTPQPDHQYSELKAELRNINEKLGKLIGAMEASRGLPSEEIHNPSAIIKKARVVKKIVAKKRVARKGKK